MRKELPKVYEPQQVESRIYQMWEDNNCFNGDPDPKKKPFSILRERLRARDLLRIFRVRSTDKADTVCVLHKETVLQHHSLLPQHVGGRRHGDRDPPLCRLFCQGKDRTRLTSAPDKGNAVKVFVQNLP